MKICLVTPAGKGSRQGNRVTALRWARIIRSLGHRVRLTQGFDGGRFDALVALHARKSHDSVRRFRQALLGPMVVALTGTDVYHDLPRSKHAQESVEWADRLIALQPLVERELAPRLREKVRVIVQSVPRIPRGRVSREHFEVCVIGHLRPVKDPFRAALALAHLKATSRIRVTHLGAATTPAMRQKALALAAADRRYRWLGNRSRPYALSILSASRLLVISSKLEGGANVLSESLAANVPVLASRIPGNTALLGHHYPGYFEVGDTRGLGRLMQRAEEDARFLNDLKRRCRAAATLVRPARERAAWRQLLSELHSLSIRA